MDIRVYRRSRCFPVMYLESMFSDMLFDRLSWESLLDELESDFLLPFPERDKAPYPSTERDRFIIPYLCKLGIDILTMFLGEVFGEFASGGSIPSDVVRDTKIEIHDNLEKSKYSFSSFPLPYTNFEYVSMKISV